MGRFSPRPHNLQPYMQGGPAAFTGGLLRGLSTVTGIKDRAKRTDILEQEAESRQEMRDAQIRQYEDALLSAQIARAQEWDYREEAPVIEHFKQGNSIVGGRLKTEVAEASIHLNQTARS